MTRQLITLLLVVLPTQVLSLSVNSVVNGSIAYSKPGLTARLSWKVNGLNTNPVKTIQKARWYVMLDNGTPKIADMDSAGELVTLPNDIPVDYRGRISIEKKGNILTLLIKDVAVKDEKTYYCKVDTPGVTAQSDSVDLKLTVGPPIIDTVDPSSDSIKVTWKEPLIKGVGYIDKYTVRYSLVGKDTWVSHSTIDRSYTLKDLKPETEYRIRVSAWDSKGQGPESVKKIVKTEAGVGGLSSTIIGIIVAVIVIVIICVIICICVCMRQKKQKDQKDSQMFRVNGSAPAHTAPSKEPFYEIPTKQQPLDTYSSIERSSNKKKKKPPPKDKQLVYADIDFDGPRTKKPPSYEETQYANVTPSQPKQNPSPMNLGKDEVYIESTYANV